MQRWLIECREIIQLPNVRENYGLFSQNADNIFRYNIELGMLAWREGGSPRPFFEEAIDDFIMYRNDLASRGMTTAKLPNTEAVFIATLLDRQSAFVLGACELDVCGDVFLDCHLAKRLLGLPADDSMQAGFERLGKRAKRHALAIRTYEVYFHLIALDSSSADVEQSVAAADANYAARRRDGYYSGGHSTNGGGEANDFVIDYRLAAIMKYRGIERESVHRWRW